MRGLILLLVAAALPAAAQNTNDPREVTTRSYGKSDWETEQERRNFTDGEVKLPAPPKAENLIEFFPSSATSFRFFIDAASFTLESGGVIRYILVARSPSGYDNVTYEGMRCSSNSFRIYAYGNAGRWSRADTEWKPIEAKSVQRWHNELRSRYFCPSGASILTTAEGLNALRRGGHPFVSGTQERY